MQDVLPSKTPARRFAQCPRLGTVLAALLAMAAMGSSPAQEPESHPGSPPPEAVTACASKQPGAPCYFRGGYRTITGTCEAKVGDLVCVPDRPPPGPPGGGREASAHERTDGRGDGAPGDQDQGYPGSSIQRQKDRPPPPLETGPRPPPEAFAACTLASEGSVCVVKTPRGNISGACGMYEGRLACIPARRPD